MEYKASQLAELLDGKLEGFPDKIISNVSKIEDAKNDSITFLSNQKYLKHIYTTKAGIIVVDKNLKIKNNIDCSLIRVENSYLAFVKLLNLFKTIDDNLNSISSKSIISKDFIRNTNLYIGDFSTISSNVIIEENVKIHNNVFIGENVFIGKNTIIYSGVRILKDTYIGDNCIINSNSVIGSDGFGFAPNNNGEFIKIPQIGNVIIKNNVSILDNCIIGKKGFGFFPNEKKNFRYPHIGIVIINENCEIGCGATIDRGSMSNTEIGKNTFLDNQIHIAHNVKIGENTIIAGQVGIAGSTSIGSNVRIGGQAGISGHLKIGNYVDIAGGSGVINDISDNQQVMGYPAVPLKDFIKQRKK